MRQGVTNAATTLAVDPPVVDAGLLRRFVQAYWLRPENAFWMTLRSIALTRVGIHAPNIDVSCGDGVFTFVHCGGEFAPAFDVFSSVTDLDRVRAHHADMFDTISESYAPQIKTAPKDRVGVGVDLKRSMLARADRLGLYGKLIEHDNNNPLPLADDSFETVYCNSAYWVSNIDAFLGELGRITRPGGRVVLQVKLDAMRDYTLQKYTSMLGDRVLDIIGRGRFDCWPALCDQATWEKRFAHADLSILEATPFVTAAHAQIWDIGLRPIAPLLVKMAEAITPDTRIAIKSEWVDLFCDLLKPICDSSFGWAGDARPPAEMQYILSRR